MLAESHISVHTWPEQGSAVCDVFTCSDSDKAKDAMVYMQTMFKAQSLTSKVNIDRSNFQATDNGGVVKGLENVLNEK